METVTTKLVPITSDLAAKEQIRFKRDDGDEQTIDHQDVVGVVPTSDMLSAHVVYVEHDEKDTAAPPQIRITSGITSRTTSRTTSGTTSRTTSRTIHGDAPSLDTSDTETHIILSSGSGSNLAINFFEDAVKPALAVLFPKSHKGFHIHQTQSTETILNLTNSVFFPKADKGSLLRIILLSGDGGIIDLINGLLAKPASSDYKAPQVVLLPLGTANALYHSINAGKDNTWGLRALASNAHKPLPVFAATFSEGARLLVDEARREEELPKDHKSQYPILHGAVVGSWGMHASLVADSDTVEYRKFGLERFKMAAKEALYPASGSPPHAYKAKISILKGDTWAPLEEEEHMYVLASMVSNIEKTFTISPSSKPLDANLHLVRFGPTSGDEAMRIMGLAYQGGKHVDDPAVLYESIDGVKIEFQAKEEDPRWRRICIDGKIVRVEKDGWVEIRKEERRVLDVVVAQV
ncbi:hypothetical protein K504DRAFT_464155 [Pleomassaria siparia CBS 279.74]|uniref:DAGKc domain-containing protein n=1 Tax=Pleomassaria siparia CBS 279.74 TaxID=1314801 RepID=A0A6G1KI77_9PLEO|nr:hypothetical protein K504DRAFT_464155 [Pleomassaria siparia CBS 279.74]